MINFLITAAQVGLYSGAFQLLAVGTLAVGVSDLAMMLFIPAVIIKLLWYGEEVHIPKNPAFIFLCGVLAAAFLSGLTPLLSGKPDEMMQYFKMSSHFLYIWLFTFLCAVVRIDVKTITNIIKIIIVIALFINIFGVYQVVARAYDLPFAWLEMTNINIGGRSANLEGNAGQLSLRFGDFYRATSIFSEPSALAGFGVTVLIFIFMPFALGQKQFLRSKSFIIAVFISLVVALFLTFSLTGLVTGSLVIATALIFGKKQKIIPVVSVLFVAALLIFVADQLVSSYSGISVAELFGTRITGIIDGGQTKETTGGESFFSRWESIVIAADIWTDYPIIGKGLGLYAYADQAIKNEYGFPDSTLAAALAEMGIIGFLCVLGVNLSLTFHTILLLRRKQTMFLLPSETKRLLTIIPFILVTTTAGTAIGNSLVNLWMWLAIAFCFPVYNAVLREAGYEFLKFKLVQIPFKERFRLAMKQNADVHKPSAI